MAENRAQMADVARVKPAMGIVGTCRSRSAKCGRRQPATSSGIFCRWRVHVTVERQLRSGPGIHAPIEENLRRAPPGIAGENCATFTRHGFKTWLREVKIADAVEVSETASAGPAPSAQHRPITNATTKPCRRGTNSTRAAKRSTQPETHSLFDIGKPRRSIRWTAQTVGSSLSVEAGS